MKVLSEYFETSLSAEERLNHFSAYVKGVGDGLRKNVNHLESLLSLLEMELEDNPAAEKYFTQAQENISSTFATLEELQTVLQNVYSPFEKIDPDILADALTNRLQKLFVGRISRIKQGKTVLINGNLLLLQEGLLPLLLAYIENKDEIIITTDVKELSLDYLKLFHSSSLPGDYFILNISSCRSNSKNIPLPANALFDKDSFSRLKDRFSLIYGVITLHGGDIFCTKNLDSNFNFSVILPLSHTEKSYMHTDSRESVDDKDLFGSETILLVDDEDMIWDVVIDMLQNMGYTVILAGNGLEALDVYSANPNTIDLVILDMLMPEMDGQHAFFKLQEINPDIKVLLSSGYVAETDAKNVLDAGAVGFLKKPYRMVDLARKIRSIFNET